MIKLEYRCPWCGELLIDPSKKSKSKVYFKQFDPFAKKCNYCGNMSTRIATLMPLLLLVVGIVVLTECPIPAAAWIPFLGMIYLAGFRIAHERKSSEKWDGNLPKDIFVGVAFVHWYTCKEGGIGLPRLRIPNNFIFPICFVDTDKRPISPMICMRFTKKMWWKSECQYDIYSISEDNMKYIRDDFEQFFIYSGRQKIGEGNIRTFK